MINKTVAKRLNLFFQNKKDTIANISLLLDMPALNAPELVKILDIFAVTPMNIIRAMHKAEMKKADSEVIENMRMVEYFALESSLLLALNMVSTIDSKPIVNEIKLRLSKQETCGKEEQKRDKTIEAKPKPKPRKANIVDTYNVGFHISSNQLASKLDKVAPYALSRAIKELSVSSRISDFKEIDSWYEEQTGQKTNLHHTGQTSMVLLYLQMQWKTAGTVTTHSIGKDIFVYSQLSANVCKLKNNDVSQELFMLHGKGKIDCLVVPKANARARKAIAENLSKLREHKNVQLMLPQVKSHELIDTSAETNKVLDGSIFSYVGVGVSLDHKGTKAKKADTAILPNALIGTAFTAFFIERETKQILFVHECKRSSFIKAKL